MGVKETEDIVNDTISIEDLKQFEAIYKSAEAKGMLSHTEMFEYAYCLVRSSYEDDVKKGLRLFKELIDDNYDGSREILYYLAVGNFKLKNYRKALEFTKLSLNAEPNNTQVRDLHTLIEAKLRKDAFVGAAAVGSVAFGVVGAAVVGAAYLLTKKK